MGKKDKNRQNQTKMKNKWTKIVKNAKLYTIGQKWTKMKGGRN